MNRRNFIQTASVTTILPQIVLSASASSPSKGSQTMTITPFKIKIPQKQINDLKLRLEMMRWPSVVTDDWSRGQPVSFIKELTNQWLNKYDWRKHEAQLNRYPQFMTEIDGQPIHFFHIKSPEPKAFPLILTHGWPSSVVECLNIAGPLSDPRTHGLDPALAFDLVIPSLPGFGFSSPMTAPGWDTAHVAKAWDILMKGLGYARYGAQGGDIGSLVGKELGILNPKGLVGTHLQQIFAYPKGTPGEMDKLSPFEKKGMANFKNFEKFGGYQPIQQKRPATLAYGLVDSPVGEMAWNAELFFGFSGEAAKTFDRDVFLSHASIYWFTVTSGSAANIYYEDAQSGSGYNENRNDTPTGVAVFPYDFISVRSFAERANNIVHWTEMPKGGHFAAHDAPDLLVADIRTFFAKLI
jgi:epoxide hydrolase